MLREVLKNNAASTLSAAITSTGATTLTVTSATPFPTTGTFRILIDSEIMTVRAVSGTTFTVDRGSEGSTAATHSSGAAVTHILTQGALLTYCRQNDPYFDSSRPAFGLQDASGNPLTSASFTAVNQGSTTITDQSGTIAMNLPHVNATNAVLLSRLAAAAPYTITACLRGNFLGNNFLRMGIGFRDSVGGSLMLSQIEAEPAFNYQLLKYSSPTAFNTTSVTRIFWSPGDKYWFRISDDATNLIFSISHDGVNWIQMYSEARGTFFTGHPDSVCFYAENNGTTVANFLASLVHWDEG